VQIDGTIIVIQSGNHEFIGIRHRETQTLYISDLIEPPTCKEPSYGKLHVGLYIAAIQDLMDRAKRRVEIPHDDEDFDNGDKPERKGRGSGGSPRRRRNNGGDSRDGSRRAEGSNQRLEQDKSKGDNIGGGVQEKGEMAGIQVRMSDFLRG
jgi:hypothetical protein